MILRSFNGFQYGLALALTFFVVTASGEEYKNKISCAPNAGPRAASNVVMAENDYMYWAVYGSAYWNDADTGVVHFDGPSPCKEGDLIPAKSWFYSPDLNYLCTIEPGKVGKFYYHVEIGPKCPLLEGQYIQYWIEVK
jgi:hypothetical protein